MRLNYFTYYFIARTSRYRLCSVQHIVTIQNGGALLARFPSLLFGIESLFWGGCELYSSLLCESQVCTAPSLEGGCWGSLRMSRTVA